MKLLDGKFYDFTSAAVTKSCASLLAMTAIDTTNLRCSFTGPSNGVVLVRARVGISGATSSPQILLGVLDGATVKVRQAPMFSRTSSSANAVFAGSMSALVAVTPGTAYNWDLAYGVEFAVASSAIKYGGPNDTSANNQYGGILFEVYEVPGVLAWQNYDPASAVTSFSVASALAMTAIDTTNLRCTFVAPGSGIVAARMRGVISGTTGVAQNLVFGVLDGVTLRGRIRPFGWYNESSTVVATDQMPQEANWLITGLTGGTTYNFDAAVGVDSGGTSAVLKYGGPDNTTQDDAWGGFSFEIWNPSDVPRVLGGIA